MIAAGQACLIVAFAAALYGIAASLYGARAQRRDFVASGRRAVYAMAGATAVAFVLLEVAFVRSDFSFAVVTSHSSTTTPLFYRLTAMWSSQEGSLLLWLFLLGTWSSVILFLTRQVQLHREVLPRPLDLSTHRNLCHHFIPLYVGSSYFERQTSDSARDGTSTGWRTTARTTRAASTAATKVRTARAM